MEILRWAGVLTSAAVDSQVSVARSAIEQVHRHPANLRGWPRTAAAASVRAARASAVLDGGAGRIDPEAETVTDPVLAGALRVAAEIGTLVKVWERAPLQALARLHTLAAVGIAHPEALGRPEVDRPAVSGLLTRLATVVVSAGWPAPIKVAIVHGELLALAPFGSCDGVVARGAARLTMITTGLDPHGLSVPEVGHLRAAATYRDAVADLAADLPNAVEQWVLHVCAGLITGAREALSIAEAAS